MDDQPVWFKCRGSGRILAVPYPQELNDIPAIVARKETGSNFADMIVDQFDEMIELSEKRPLVMGVALHAYIVGQPHRLRHLQARPAPHRPAPRRRLAHHARRDRAALCAACRPGTIP